MTQHSRTMVAVAILFALTLPGWAHAKECKRPKGFPKGQQTSFGLSLLPATGGWRAVDMTFQRQFSDVWSAAVRAAETFEKLGGRTLFYHDSKKGKIQNGQISPDAAFAAEPGAWQDVVVTQVESESADETKVIVARRVARLQMLGKSEWKSEPSNGEVECWLLWQVRDELEKAPQSPEAHEVAAPSSSVPPPPQALTNSDIVKLVEAELSDTVILATISGSACNFDMSPDALISLKGSSVSDAVIQAMMDAGKK